MKTKNPSRIVGTDFLAWTEGELNPKDEDGNPVSETARTRPSDPQ